MVRQRSDRSSNCESSRPTPRVPDAREAAQMNEVADSSAAGNTRSGGLATSADGLVSPSAQVCGPDVPAAPGPAEMNRDLRPCAARPGPRERS